MIILRKVKTFFKKILSPLFYPPFIVKPFPKKPFGTQIKGSYELYLRLHRKAILNINSDVKDFEKKSGYIIDDNWLNNLALHTNTCIKKSELNFNHGRLIYSALAKYINDEHKDKDSTIIILETGTARGFSSICMSKALIDHGQNGFITSVDCISHNEKIMWNSISDFDGPKTRADLLSSWPTELSKIIFIQGWTDKTIKRLGFNRINFAFLDAQHTKKDVLNEFYYVYKRQKKGDIIIFDDVTYGQFDGVCKAVEFIKENYPYRVENLSTDKKRGYAIATRI